MVLYVRPGAGVSDLRTAVDRADPSGQSMAVATTSYGQLAPLIAVDTARFASVGAWVSGNSSVSLPSILNRLKDSGSPVTLSGARLRLHVDLIKHPRQAVDLVLKLAEPNHSPTTITVAPVAQGVGSYLVSLPSGCASGCRITGLDLTAPASESGEIKAAIGASILSHRRWRPVNSFADVARWRGDGKGPVRISDRRASLLLDVQEFYGWWPGAVSASIPTAISAVVASAEAAAEPGNAIHNLEVVGLDRQALFVDGVIRAVTLPQVNRGGVMIDFGAALAAMNHRSARRTQYEVWLSPDAPRDMSARLAHEHVYVERVVRAASYRAVLDDTGPAFADSLFLLSALAATVLAIAASAIGRVLSVRRRAYELAALEAVGLSPRSLRRATAAEQGSVFGIGLLVGLAAGIVGSLLALPSTPVFVKTSTGPPLVVGLPWALLAAMAAGMIIVFVLVSIAIARVVDRAATPNQLRGAQQ